MKDSEREKVFLVESSKRARRVREYLDSEDYRGRFSPRHMSDSAYNYLNSGGKCLRPAILFFSCGAVGGDESKALPAAAAIEVFHTWTLAHDDIIDSDKKRRGRPTLHEEFSRRGQEELGLDPRDAEHYGLSVAILTGDLQHGWSVSLLTELTRKYNLSPQVTLCLIEELNTYVTYNLLCGELLDVQYSRLPIQSLREKDILTMLWKKTAVLYEFAGRAGAMIGLEVSDPHHRFVQALSLFANRCGLAFQLQDDILGIVGDEEKLGKSVGSDIREGKRTTIVYYAFQKASTDQKRHLGHILGNKNATEEQVREVAELLVELGAVERTQRVAKRYVTEALEQLQELSDSRYKQLLATWADYIVSRES
jgi:geranylgeranyl diphosphate synthase type I